MKKLILSLFILCLSATTGFAKITIDVRGGKIDPFPIAIQEFETSHDELKKIATDIRSVVENDLNSSGIIRILDKESHLNTSDKIGNLPSFNDWKIIKAQSLVQAKLIKKGLNQVRIEFYIWDVISDRQIHAEALVSYQENWRRLAHILSDAIYTAMTGDKGYFDSRVVYISESGPATMRVKQLAIMDYDGHNHKYLTDGNTLVLTPVFAPNMQRIAFMSYYKEIPRVYIFDLQTGIQTVLGDFPGMTYAPRFSPKGDKVILSMAKDGNSEIYEIDLQSKKQTRLTRHPAIDTSPAYSPDGEKIVFNSDRGGTPQLYMMNKDGSGVQRISFGDGRYFTPIWSPRGDYVAFTKIKGNQFYVGIMFPDGEGERLLAKGYSVEGPTWSPNGRRLIYFKQTLSKDRKTDRTRLYSVDITGYHEYEMKTPRDASDPAWSPLLP